MVSLTKRVGEIGKLISVKLSSEQDIVSFITTIDLLTRRINELLADETDYAKVLCAKYRLTGELAESGEEIANMMVASGDYSLEGFFDAVFVLRFPQPEQSLDLGFRTLTQSHPNKLSIVDYSSRFRVFVKRLGLRLESNLLKWIEGLSNAEVRNSLYRYPYQKLGFGELIEVAVGMENSLVVAKKSAGRALAALDDEDEGDEWCCKIMGLPFMDYVKKLTQRNVSERVCFNCFSTSHRSGDCFRKNCRFCGKAIDQVGHLSLMCGRCPSDLSSYVQHSSNSARGGRGGGQNSGRGGGQSGGQKFVKSNLVEGEEGVAESAIGDDSLVSLS